MYPEKKWYEVKLGHLDNLYYMVSLKWNYKKTYLTMSNPEYVKNVIQRCCHLKSNN